ncbi:DUF222 domain-containing protein [Gordonia sp. ABSL1-1]|uniref:DUF222 domain-containing protein n=1 Tax=Gordonia sp. ABSL1-1 TaxID=3053923 RepID=UPI00257313AD|nr:DUF222 domain-containing protein [Gordonia sp. ABSL1-1]MDL9935743.1 DUF222 domain-containing protein [Gordonia sp. ABSL1-1]
MTKTVMVPADSAAAGVAGLSVCAQAEAFAQWLSYRLIGELHDAVLADEMAVGVDVDADTRLLDTTIQVAARIAVSRHITQCAAERLLAAGLAMRDRLPAVGACLRDGLIAGYQFAAIVTRTDLVDGEHMSVVDAGIADRLRRARGGWSVAGLRTMVDRIVFRHDPDAVRRKRDAALADRGTWITSAEGGMAHLGVSMSAENARISHDAVVRLAATACRNDRRRKPARESDAMFALLSGEPFICECDRADCDAQIPEPVHYRGVHARVMVHVVADAGTVAGEANRPGFVDGSESSPGNTSSRSWPATTLCCGRWVEMTPTTRYRRICARIRIGRRPRWTPSSRFGTVFARYPAARGRRGRLMVITSPNTTMMIRLPVGGPARKA